MTRGEMLHFGNRPKDGKKRGENNKQCGPLVIVSVIRFCWT